VNPASQVTPPPERFNFAQHLLQQNADRATKVAIIDDAGSLTYGELAQRVRSLATALCSLGLRREERVLLLMHDCAEWPISFLGAMYAGLVPVAVNTLLTVDDYAFMLEHSRAQAVLISGDLLPLLNAALVKSDHEVKKIVVVRPVTPPHPDQVEFDSLLQLHTPLARPAATYADDPGFWLYSSGSTGRPKATVHSHANPYWTIELYGKGVLAVEEADVCFSAAKLFFAYGLGNALSFPFGVGATTLLMAERPTPEAIFKRWLGAVGGRQPTVFYCAPTGYAGILASPHLPARPLLRLRLASSAGEALPAEIGERFRAHLGVDIVDGIGSSEMLHIFMSNRPGRIRHGSTGWPVPGYDIELRGEDGRPVPDGEPGDLYIRGPSAALMYWGNRAKSRETFQGGWTKSGDKYVRNADGTFTFGGRSDDMIKVSGMFVSPFEVESTLVLHPAVLEAAVIGLPDRDGLTKTKAFVVLKADCSTSESELKAFVKNHLAPYKYPRAIEFVSELPKTATGKIQRFRLRERESQRQA
jgi:benzoate-CoA ligase